MIAVIQCAGRKARDAAHFQTAAGQRVTFVADPNAVGLSDDVLYEHPDDMSDYGWTWREALLKYNDDPSHNPLRLLPAWQLYDNVAYRRLFEKLGPEKLFILSAGWGLIRAGFLTPYYDITFSAQAESYKRRRKNDLYRDLNMLGAATDDLVFFGSKDYLRPFCTLTAAATGRRIVFYNSGSAPSTPGCALAEHFKSPNLRKWHYECATAFVNGDLAV